MKKRWNVAIGVCFVAMGMVLSACTAKADKMDSQAVTSSAVAQSKNSASEVASSEVTSAVADQNKVTAEKVRVGALKGPTSLGMLKMMEDDSAKDVNYAFQVAGSPDEIAPKLVSGDVDIIAAPVNMGSVLYNKTQGKVRMLAINTLGVLYIGEKGESDIKSIADLKGKTVSVGDAGSGTEFNARQLLDAYGLSFNDIKVQNLSFGDSAEALKDGKIDAFFCVAGAPTTAVVELATTNSIHVLSVDEDKMQVLKSKYPFYTEYKIPAGTYKGVDNEVTSAAVKATFIVSDKLDEDTVYQMTKAIFENKSKIAHAKAEQLDPKFAVEGITIPFHPGAQKYYKEVGAMK